MGKVHIGFQRHIPLCNIISDNGICTCSDSTLEFQDKETGLPAVTCEDCLELSKLTPKELVGKIRKK